MNKQDQRQNRIERWFPWIVGGAALLIRFFYLWGFWTSHPFAQKLVSDARVFDDWGRRIAAGDWLGRAEVFDLPPLYAYALGVFYTVFGYAPQG
ncbi:MAG: hypothetical protein HOE48_11355, partial [Candidatus Latescibacteria bacterium]|nr:hypothetical protein [Candidatus Latescibacterota bacterium]